MDNLIRYENYKPLYEADEIPMDLEDFDPEAFKKAVEDWKRHTKSGDTDVDNSGLSFVNIKQVFGREDYNFRVAIAQALYLAGMNLFPTNKYHAKDIQSFDIQNYGNTMTFYIGEAPQNAKLKNVSVAQLNAIKSLANKVASGGNKYFGGSWNNGKWNYTQKQMMTWPDVKAAKAALAKAA
jgi:hypothetical protein